MHESLLPDETLHRILAYCLVVPPEVFLQFPTGVHGGTPPYASQKRLRYLLVSKRWHKVGKPLLYTSVVLSKSAHTKLLAANLMDTPELGRKIHTLRLEGGYGRDFSYIVSVSPNIKHLYLNLEIASSDTIAGLRKSLTTMDPTTFYAHQVGLFGVSHNNQTVVELRAIMETCISSRWANLKNVYLCDSFPMSPAMAGCLRKADKLDELHVATADARKWLDARADPAVPLATVLHSPNLQIVRCRGLAEKDAVFACLGAIPSLPQAIPLFIFEPRHGEQDESRRDLPDLLEAATRQLLACTSMPDSGAVYIADYTPQYQFMDYASGSQYQP